MPYTYFSGLPFYVSLFWLILLLLEFRDSNPAKRVLTLFMVTCTALYFSHAVYFLRESYLYSWIDSIYTFCTLAVYPLYYLYIRKLTCVSSFSWREYSLLLPSLIVSLLSIFFYALMSDDERVSFVEVYVFNQGSITDGLSWAQTGQIYRLTLMKILFLVQLIPVSYSGFRMLTRFKDQINNFYADTEKKTLTPTRILLPFFILFALLSAVANQLGKHFFLQEPWLVIFPSLIFSSMIFALCYIGYKQNFTAHDFYDEMQKAKKVETENPNTNSKVLMERIRKMMEEEQFFRKKDLHITDIAIRVGSNRTYISRYINQAMQLSFSDYVNSYRIEYAKSLMIKPDIKLSLLEISEESGFTNEVSFYRNFKKITGTTPSHWIKQHKSGEHQVVDM